MSIEELLHEGMEAARTGQNEKAARLFALVVQQDSNSELGWLYLGLCRSSSKEQEYCFKRVLGINPANLQARQKLDQLHGGALPPSAPEGHLPLGKSAQPSVEAPFTGPVASQPEPEAEQISSPLPSPRPAASSPAEPATSVGKPEPSQSFIKGQPSPLLSIPPAPVENPPSKEKASQPPSKSRSKPRFAWLGLVALAALLVAFAGGYWLWTQGRLPLLLTPITSDTPSVSPTTANTPDGQAQAYSVVFEAAACPVELPSGATADCGFVIVPEDRQGDDLQDTIRLAVIRYRSRSDSPLEDPIVFLQGGPGADALSWSVEAYDTVILPFLDARDFVVFDPRGTGSSQPALECDEVMRTYYQDLQGKVPIAERASYYEGAALTCKATLAQAGVNLPAYTSVDMAADFKDILTALGYAQADLFGVGYGTRVAQVVMRDYPGMVRSAVLDSVIPLDLQLADRTREQNEYALERMFEGCSADEACKSAYPDLRGDYERAVHQLDAQPVSLSIPIGQGLQFVHRVNGPVFQDAVSWSLRTSQTITLAPALIHKASQGDYSILSFVISIPLQTYDSINLGVYIAVNCHDQVLSLTTKSLDSIVSDMCPLWETRPLAQGENELGVSGIPALMISGKYDSITPPIFAEQLRDNLTGGHFVVIPDQGHAPTLSGISVCPLQIIGTFLDSPFTEPEQTCALQTPEMSFVVPYTRDVPIQFTDLQDTQTGVITRYPEGWSRAGPTLFERDNSPVDSTQVSVQRANTSEQAWLQSLSGSFSSLGGGLDSPPVPRESLVVDDLEWHIYSSTYLGLPVDIAFSTLGSNTVLVIMLSAVDEHEALYENVFIPILQVTRPIE